jgi:hypothetical protein
MLKGGWLLGLGITNQVDGSVSLQLHCMVPSVADVAFAMRTSIAYVRTTLIIL